MKRLAILSLVIILSCDNYDRSIRDKSQILGKWVLVGQLVDPGDGSGRFHRIISEKSLEIFSDSTVICNRDLCSINDHVAQSTVGVFNSAYEISSSQCPDLIGLKMELLEGNLIIHHQCIEPCAEKYRRVN